MVFIESLNDMHNMFLTKVVGVVKIYKCLGTLMRQEVLVTHLKEMNGWYTRAIKDMTSNAHVKGHRQVHNPKCTNGYILKHNTNLPWVIRSRVRTEPKVTSF